MKCPHCSVAIEGVVTQDTLRERLAAKDQQISTLREEAAEVASLRTAAEEGRKASAELGALRAERVRAEAFAKYRVKNDPKVRERLGKYYDAETTGTEAPPDFDTWLGSDDTRAVFGAHYESAAPPAKPGTPAAPPPAATRTTATTTGEAPPAHGSGVRAPTAQELAQELAGPAYQGLPPKERMAKIKARQTEVNALLAATPKTAGA